MRSPCLGKKRSSKMGVMSTPTKKPVRNAELERAARKEQPFRNVDLNRHLFA